MANLSIRKLDPSTYRRLKLRAAQHNHSMEEEVRCIIFESVNSSESIGSIFTKHFGETNGLELELPNQRKPHNPIDLE